MDAAATVAGAEQPLNKKPKRAPPVPEVIDLCGCNSSSPEEEDPQKQLLDQKKQSVVFFELDEDDNEVEIVGCNLEHENDDSDSDEIEIVDPPPKHNFIHVLNDPNLDDKEKQQQQHLQNKNDDDDDHDSVQVVATSMRSLPHMRQHCTVHPFSNRTDNCAAAKNNNKIACNLCYCYVCDVPVKECKEWSVHCMATNEIYRWKILREGVKHGTVREASEPKIIFEGRMKRGKRLKMLLDIMDNFQCTQFHMNFEPTCISVREFGTIGGMEFKLFRSAFHEYRCIHPSTIFVDHLQSVLNNLTDCRRKSDSLKLEVTDSYLRLEVVPTCTYRMHINTAVRFMQIREERKTDDTVAWDSSHVCKCNIAVKLFDNVTKGLFSRYFESIVFSSDDDSDNKDSLLLSALDRDRVTGKSIIRNSYEMKPSPRHDIHLFERVRSCPDCQNAVRIEKLQSRFRLPVNTIKLQTLLHRVQLIPVGPFMEFRVTESHHLRLDFELSHGATKEGFFHVFVAPHVENEQN
jgi:hypothetical protein